MGTPSTHPLDGGFHDGKNMRVGMVIATKRRAELVHKVANAINEQSLLPNMLCISCSCHDDMDESKLNTKFPVTVIYSKIGASAQRNAGIEHVIKTSDYVIFIDDDFIMHHQWIENMVKAFEDNNVVGVDGRLIRDGAREKKGGINFEEALASLKSSSILPSSGFSVRKHLYGCNMAYRCSAIENVRFDEKLPLYSWLEDLDFSHNAGEMGALRSYNSLLGVHMGSKGGKVLDRLYGVSQIMNSVYLYRKGSIGFGLLMRFTIAPFIKNACMSLFTSPFTDHKQRLKGNLFALKKLMNGECDPSIISRMHR